MTALTNASDIKVLRLLKEAGGSFVSGQLLSEELNVSRSAVWKHIEGLREMGCPIEASKARGYKLAKKNESVFNGVEIASSLTTEFIGKNIYFFDELSSTNTKAFELASSGEACGTAVIADLQTGGKGRIGRQWHSPAGKNIYTSVILRPEISPIIAPQLTLPMAVAVAGAIEGFCGVRPEVKWPNDVLINGKKVAGVLTEMSSEADRVNHIVAGIGVNLNMSSVDMPTELSDKATSIAAVTGKEFSRAGFASALYGAIEKWYGLFLSDGLAPVAHEWRSYFNAEGKRIKVDAINKSIEGICAGLDDDGALLVREATGDITRVAAGDMSLL